MNNLSIPLKIDDELKQLRDLTGSDYSGYAKFDQSINRIKWIHVSGNRSERYKEIALLPGRGLAGAVIRYGRPIIMDNKVPDLEHKRFEYSIMLVEHLKTAAAIPVIKDHETIGVLLIGKRSEGIYTSEKLNQLKSAMIRLATLL